MRVDFLRTDSGIYEVTHYTAVSNEWFLIHDDMPETTFLKCKNGLVHNCKTGDEFNPTKHHAAVPNWYQEFIANGGSA